MTATVPPGAGGGGGDDAAPAEPLFQATEVLADRFRVVRLLGRGGMGEVYEVDDLELGERVAVKTLRSHLLASDRALALFRNEIQLARRVTHPNVCRVFDVFRHKLVAGGASESVALVTMERLPGETLAERLERRGPLVPAAALPILRQIAEALDAAHAAGIVHRDLKSSNVVLVDRPGGPRAVVTDFGIAAAAEEAAAGASPAGTAPYMAPEQHAGGATGPAADLHAFGVLVREMVTGRTAPGPGGSADLPPGWAPVVARCLSPEPAERPPSALDVHRRLAAAAGGRRRRVVRAALAAAVALTLVLAGGALFRAEVPRDDAGAPAAEAPPIPARRALALTVAPASGPAEGAAVPRWVSIAATLLLAGELEAIDLELSPRSPPFAFTSEAASDGFADVAAGVTISATADGALRLDLELRGAGPGPKTASRVVAVEALPRATAELAAVVAGSLGVARSPDAPANRRARLGDDPAALEALARGLAAVDEVHPARALPDLSRAVALEPSAFEPRCALAHALIRLGRTGEARDHADAARRLAEALGPGERRMAAALLALADADYADAAAAYGELVRLRPGRLDLAIQHAEMLRLHRQGAPARQALEEAAQRLPFAQREPRYLLTAAALASQESDYPNQIALARAARSRALELGLRGLAFWALQREYLALVALERTKEIEEISVEAVELARSIGEPWLFARALRIRSVARLKAGEIEDGRRLLETAVSEARRAGDLENLLWCIFNLAYVALSDGDLERAEGLYRDSLDILRLQGDNQEGIFFVRGRLAEVSRQRGHLAEADSAAREILLGARSLGSTELESSSLELLARVALEREELDEAAHRIAALEALARDSEPGRLPTALALAADLGRRRGAAVTAKRLAEQSLAAFDRGGTASERAYPLEIRARVESDIAGPAAGLAAMREAMTAAADVGLAHDVARIERETARLERLSGDLAEARRILTRALAVHERSGAELELAHDRLELARLRAAEGDPGGAAAAARQALADYRRLGHRGGAAAALAFLSRDPEAGAGGEV